MDRPGSEWPTILPGLASLRAAIDGLDRDRGAHDADRRGGATPHTIALASSVNAPGMTSDRGTGTPRVGPPSDRYHPAPTHTPGTRTAVTSPDQTKPSHSHPSANPEVG